jgi:hypothetical protein
MGKKKSNKILLQKRNKNKTFGCDKKTYPKLTFKKELTNSELKM